MIVAYRTNSIKIPKTTIFVYIYTYIHPISKIQNTKTQTSKNYTRTSKIVQNRIG